MISKRFFSRPVLWLSLFCGAGALIGGFWWYYAAPGITPYSSYRDRAAILSLFDKNWYWLVSEYSLGFSPEYMLDNAASSQSPEHVGNLSLHVYRADNKTVGFLATYLKSPLRGYILFLVVDDAYRGKGYARALMNFGLKNLSQKGVHTIELVTRVSNTAARSLYESSGFVENWRDGGFVHYEYAV
jgi:ribosomal protein S18 acetylase RimI-like enzyme